MAREKPKRADYVLYLSANNPIAIVEAKDNNHTVSHGLQQAMTYAQMLDVPFAFSSNGDGFAEHDFLTGKERTFGLDEFPTEKELVERYKAGANDGAGLTDVQEKLIAQPYYSSQNTYPPRYYQRIAINRTLDAIARGQNRLLLVMATGTGKTYTAFQIVYRLLKSGLKKKILYLADRNNLVDQSIQQDFAPLEKVIHKVNFSKDDPRTITSYEVYFSLYQQLAGKNEEQDENAENALDKLSQLFSPDFFDLIIVDECHRGSAKKESNWRKILEYFASATQIGMTATPKETKYVSNIDYFGEPIYTYSLKEGIEDGFLAPFKVINVMTDIGEGWRPRKGQRDIYGNEIEDRIYTNSDYDYNIIIEDRINQVAAEITRYLKSTDRMAKTIVFCPTEEAAERMQMALANQNADMMKQNPDYVVRITGSDTYGKSKLDYFISVGSKYPVIATTSKLLSTGSDCKMTKLIVLDEMIGSMTEFKQIVGRGTRVREDCDKLYFTIMDFRKNYVKFADPEFDGDPVKIKDVGEDDDFGDDDTDTPDNGDDTDTDEDGFDNGDGDNGNDGSGDNGDDGNGDEPGRKKRKRFTVNGVSVRIIDEKVEYLDSNGNLITVSIIDYSRNNLRRLYPYYEEFRKVWLAQKKKQELLDQLLEDGVFIDYVKDTIPEAHVDDYDVLSYIGYEREPLTKEERIDHILVSGYLDKFSKENQDIIRLLLEAYREHDIDELKNIRILNMPEFIHIDKPTEIVRSFGGKQKYMDTINEIEQQIYSA